VCEPIDPTGTAEFLRAINDHRGAIHRVTRAYAAGADAREELFQEIVYQLWRAFPAFRRQSSAMTWIYRIALNTAITDLRRRVRRPTQVPLDTDLDIADPRLPSDGRSDRIELLYRAIRQLTAIDRAIVMCYLDDLPYKRIGEILGLSESTVGARLTRVKGKLQQLVETLESPWTSKC
jgi:RNA polymerase sigma-70 factor (ECF subfamily)